MLFLKNNLILTKLFEKGFAKKITLLLLILIFGFILLLFYHNSSKININTASDSELIKFIDNSYLNPSDVDDIVYATEIVLKNKNVEMINNLKIVIEKILKNNPKCAVRIVGALNNNNYTYSPAIDIINFLADNFELYNDDSFKEIEKMMKKYDTEIICCGFLKNIVKQVTLGNELNNEIYIKNTNNLLKKVLNVSTDIFNNNANKMFLISDELLQISSKTKNIKNDLNRLEKKLNIPIPLTETTNGIIIKTITSKVYEFAFIKIINKNGIDEKIPSSVHGILISKSDIIYNNDDQFEIETMQLNITNVNDSLKQLLKQYNLKIYCEYAKDDMEKIDILKNEKKEIPVKIEELKNELLKLTDRNQELKSITNEILKNCQELAAQNLISSITSKNKKKVFEIIKCLDLNTLNLKDEKNCTPIYYAIENDDIETVSLLVSNGADLNNIFDTKNAYEVSLIKNRITLASYFKPYLKNKISNSNDSKIQKENYTENVRLDKIDSELLGAIISNDNEKLIYLINNGANINKINSDGQSYLILAVKFHSENVVDLLTNKTININLKDKNDLNAIEYALQNNLYKTVLSLKIKGGIINKNFLIYECLKSIEDRNLEKLTFIIENFGLDVNLTDVKGNSLLMISTKYGYVEIIRYLFEKNADINVINNSGECALTFAYQKPQVYEVYREFDKIKSSKNLNNPILAEKEKMLESEKKQKEEEEEKKKIKEKEEKDKLQENQKKLEEDKKKAEALELERKKMDDINKAIEAEQQKKKEEFENEIKKIKNNYGPKVK